MKDIVLENVTLGYQHQILFQDLHVHFAANTWSTLLGPSGTGKTSLLRLIANLPTGGALNHGAFISTHTHAQQVAYLSQQNTLLPWLTTLDNVLLGYRLRGLISPNEKEQAISLLARVGLNEALLKRPDALSGGMQQRAMLVRTLLENKPIILLDEPFSAVDVITRYKLQNLAFELLKDKTVILVTHDPLEALRLSHHIYILNGAPARVTSNIKLNTAPLRDAHDPMVLALQADLLAQLQCETLP